MIFVKAQQMKENLCPQEKKKRVRSSVPTAHLLSRLSISAQYISSEALTGLLTLSVSVCTSVHAMTTKLSTHQLTAPFSTNASLHQPSKAFA